MAVAQFRPTFAVGVHARHLDVWHGPVRPRRYGHRTSPACSPSTTRLEGGGPALGRRAHPAHLMRCEVPHDGPEERVGPASGGTCARKRARTAGDAGVTNLPASMTPSRSWRPVVKQAPPPHHVLIPRRCLSRRTWSRRNSAGDIPTSDRKTREKADSDPYPTRPATVATVSPVDDRISAAAITRDRARKTPTVIPVSLVKRRRKVARDIAASCASRVMDQSFPGLSRTACTTSAI